MIEATQARRIRLIGFDVDGVLTDGGVYMGQAGDQPVELKRFDIQDGMGIKFLRDGGLTVAFVSARRSDATGLRARDLKVEEVLQTNKKLPAFAAMLERRGVRWEECAFLGDDIPDLPLLKRVGLPMAVANAVPEVKAVAHFVTQAQGGHGAVREIAEVVLKAHGVWETVLNAYLTERGDAAARAGRAD